MNKKAVGAFLFVASTILMVASHYFSITGYSISSNANNLLQLVPHIGIFLLFVSLLFLTTRQSLDAILIPIGPSLRVDKERAHRAIEDYQQRKLKPKLIMISGRLEREGGARTSQRYRIYSELRGYGIKPSEIKIEGESENTLENVLFSLKKIEKLGARDIGIASNPSHLDRIEEIIKQGKKEGIINSNLHVYRLESQETAGSRVYGYLSGLLNRYRLRRGVEKARESKTPEWIKKIGGYIFDKFK